jgi:PAS domain S-box-containing protein
MLPHFGTCADPSILPPVPRNLPDSLRDALPEWYLRLLELPQATPDFIFSTSLDGTILWANPALERLAGEPLVGRNVGLFRPDWVRELLEVEGRPTALRDGFWVGQTAIAIPGQPERPVRQVLVPHRDEAGELAGYSAALQDLSEQSRVAEQLRAISETVPVGVFVNDADGKCEWVNATYCEMTGRSADSLLGDGWRDVLLPGGREFPARAVEALARTGQFGPVEVPYLGADGQPHTASVRVRVLRNADGSVRGSVGVVADITSARAQQDALAFSEERFRAVLGTIQEGIVMHDASGAVTLWNSAALDILGLTEEQLRGVTPTDPRWRVVDADGRALPGDRHPATIALRTGQPVSEVIMGVARPDERLVWLRASALPITLPGAAHERGVVVTFVDITEQRLAEERLRASERELRALTDAAREAICLHEADGTYRWVSEGASEVLGWEPARLLGRNAYDYFHPDDIERVRREAHEPTLEGTDAHTITYRFRRADGRYTWLETTSAIVPAEEGAPLRIVTTSRSADARVADEARKSVRQRLGGVTHFAGRLAHDFTNLYTVLQSRLELMRDRLEGDVREDLEAAFAAIDRATELTRALRALGGREMMSLVPVTLESLVAELGPELARTTGARVVVHEQAHQGPISVLLDRDAFAATLLAVVRNAVEAQSSPATITLQTELVRVQQPIVEAHGEVPTGDWAVVRCRDVGPGIAEDVLVSLFEPEFSIKRAQVETGLGLPVALARMQRMLGHLSVARRPEGGTEVSLWLPVSRVALVERGASATDVSERRQTPAAPALPEPMADTRVPDARAPEARVPEASAVSAHVLLIDDDALVLSTARRLLERAGYRVTCASSGAEALGLLDREALSIDVLLSDVVMPGLSGPQLVAARRAAGDRRPVVYMSGYTADALPLPHTPEPDAELVTKPFTSAALVGAIERALASVR